MRRLLPSRALPHFLALGLCGCSGGSDPAEAARRFFEQITAGNARAAYDSASYVFRAQQSPTFFETMLHQLGLDSIENATYGPPEARSDGAVMRVQAEFQTKRTGKVPLVVSLVHDDGEWRVLSLRSPRQRLTNIVQDRFTMVGTPPVFIDPTQEHEPASAAEGRKLAHASLLAFNEAVQRKSFEEFFDQCAMRWQDQLARPGRPQAMPGRKRDPLSPKERELGAARLKHAFEAFVEQGVNIGGIAEMEPVLDRDPWVNTDGMLVVSGYYPTKPYRVLFSLRYWYELPLWRLFGIDVKFTQVDETAPETP